MCAGVGARDQSRKPVTATTAILSLVIVSIGTEVTERVLPHPWFASIGEARSARGERRLGSAL